MFGMGCFWGVERMFWKLPGVWMTRAGYAAGYTPNPTYEEVCSGRTGHNEVVHVIFDPGSCPTRTFSGSSGRATTRRRACGRATTWAPSTARASTPIPMRRPRPPRPRGTPSRPRLRAAGYGRVTTEILPAPEFFHAEDYHQQYLAKNPGGYCGIGGTGVTCPVGLGVA
jgi:peptide-methionine (S)-S-oxide reductase